MSVHLSIRMEQLGSHWTDFHEIWYLSILRKCVEKIQASLKSDENIGYFTWRPITHSWSYLAQFFLEWEIFYAKVVENLKTHIWCSLFFFNLAVKKIICEKCCIVDHRWQYGACALRAGKLRLHTQTLRICNTHCFSTATMVAWTRLSVALYVYCLSCFNQLKQSSLYRFIVLVVVTLQGF
jgi:hypothetical protein